jgi:tetratricopeptide (TPR) repeat protein
MTGNWKMANGMFDDYLDKYANGKFSINAHYYRGECNLNAKRIDSAVADFSYVIEKPKNIFTEPSLLNAAELNAQKGADSLAYILYSKLENQAEIKSNLMISRIGQMRAAYKLNRYNDAIEAANKVLFTDKIQEEETREARMVLGKSYKALNLFDAAIVQFRILALDVKNIEGAESKYTVAEILTIQGNAALAEETINEFINAGTPHQFWLAKAFLLLSDIYLAKGDGFQAKANLQSVIANYSNTDDGIIAEATEKLNKIVQSENKQFGIEENSDN